MSSQGLPPCGRSSCRPEATEWQQLLDEERVAAGGIRNVPDQERIGRGQELADRLGRLLLGERGKPKKLPFAEPDVARRPRPRRREDEQCADSAQSGEHRPRGVVGGVPIVDEQDHRIATCEPGDQSVQSRRRLGGRSLLAVQREQPEPDSAVRRQALVERSKALVEPLDRLVHRKLRSDPEDRAGDLKEGLKRLAPGIAFAAMHQAAAIDGMAKELLGKPGLSFPRLAADLHRGAIPGDQFAEPIEQHPHLRLPPDEGGEPCAHARRIAGVDRRPAGDREGRERLLPAPKPKRKGRARLEQIALGTEGPLADQDLVRPGLVAQARGDVGRPSEQLESPTNLVAGDEQHPSGMDPAVQPGADRAPPFLAAEREHRVAKVERSLDRPPGIVLARLRIAEGREHPVGADLRDLAFVPADDLVEDRLEAPEQVAIILGFEVACDPGRTRKGPKTGSLRRGGAEPRATRDRVASPRSPKPPQICRHAPSPGLFPEAHHLPDRAL